MNILFAGHDIAYVRFYSTIETTLRRHIEVTLLHIYLSAS